MFAESNGEKQEFVVEVENCRLRSLLDVGWIER